MREKSSLSSVTEGGLQVEDWINKVHEGDCIEVMRQLPDNCIDGIVTDPPYGIRFMGKAWDGSDIDARHAERAAALSHAPGSSPVGGHKSVAAEAGKYDLAPEAMRAFQTFSAEWATQALRLLKPGGYLLCFASTRTYHRMASGVEDAGFEVRDQIGWLFGSGFPKSHNGAWGGTALKPAWEPIVMARKPLVGTVEANWREHGTGALNIDGCRIGTGSDKSPGGTGGIPCRHKEHQSRTGELSAARRYAESGGTDFAMKPGPRGGDVAGRWPANLAHDGSDEVVAMFPREAGAASPVTVRNGDKFRTAFSAFAGDIEDGGSTFHGDTGSAARFFYCAKASKDDRNEGLQGFVVKQQDSSRKAGDPGGDNPRNRGVHNRTNHHPTVKPTDLMRWLVRLITPAGGIVLDPFMGSGSTGRAAVLEGMSYVGIEMDAEYVEIATARIASAKRQGFQPSFDLEAA